MSFSEYRDSFDSLLWVKRVANQHEQILFERAQKYISHLSWIPGIQMVSVVNSLSMYATHPDSDIDLFIITDPERIWLVRFLITTQFYFQRVWRKGDAIRGNFCLSFFITTDAMDLSEVAITDDIYLYFWIYYLKPILVRWAIYEQFLMANRWVTLDAEQGIINSEFQILDTNLWPSYSLLSPLYSILNTCIRFFLFPYTQRSYRLLWEPEWVIIADTILKFHDHDRRATIRDAILEKDFDK